MSFILITRPKWIYPVFRQFGMLVQFKRYPARQTWENFLDLATVTPDLTAINASIAALEGDVAAAAAAAAAAQVTADEALGLAESGGGGRRAAMWMDEAHYVVGTPTILVSGIYMGNFIRYTTTNLAEFTLSFVSGALNDGGIYLLGSKFANAGILEIRIDGTLVGAVDCYNATTINNQLMLIGFGFGNPTFAAGYHKLSGKVNGKFVSSSGYGVSLIKIYIRTNAD